MTFEETFEIKDLNEFSGPIDLLIHLIREKKIEIIDINLTQITNQYIEYIERVKEKSLEIASEYLTMAAYLIELKSRILIPKKEVEIEDNYEELQRQEFINRLVEYHKIKEVSKFFKERQITTSKFIAKPKSIIKITKIDDDELPLAPNTLDIDKFAKVFLKVIEKNQRTIPKERDVQLVEISPEEVKKDIIKIIEKNNDDWIQLEDLISNDKFSIGMLVVVFISILDLAKSAYLKIKQDGEQIVVKKSN